ncbi:MAG: hypothetical protein QXU32_08395 [Nitrososphaerales archaeon]
MQPTSLERDEKNSIRIYKVVFYISAAIMIVATGYAVAESLREYLTTGKVVIGEVLVNTEFPIEGFAKLVSYLMVASVVGWFCVIKLGRSKTANISKTSKSLLRLIALAFAVITSYELFYNFFVWNALMTADALSGIFRIDVLNIPYPNPKTPWSLVFATKMFLSATIISWHAFYVMSKPEQRSATEQI